MKYEPADILRRKPVRFSFVHNSDSTYNELEIETLPCFVRVRVEVDTLFGESIFR